MNTKKMTKEFREKLNSKTMWTETIEPWITDHFIFLGFNKPKDFSQYLMVYWATFVSCSISPMVK